MFIVQFFRKDGSPCEEYCYMRKENAEYHFSLFEKDDSGLYSKIRVILVDEKRQTVYNVLHTRIFEVET